MHAFLPDTELARIRLPPGGWLRARPYRSRSCGNRRCPQSLGGRAGLRIVMSGDEDDRSAPPFRLQPLRELDAGHPAELDVERQAAMGNVNRDCGSAVDRRSPPKVGQQRQPTQAADRFQASPGRPAPR